MTRVAIALAVLVPALPASAATVQLRPAGKIDEEPVNRVDIVGAAGEASALTVTVRRVGADRQGSPTMVIVHDASRAVTPLRGCVAADARTVTCEARNELGELKLVLGDGDDSASVTSISNDQFIHQTIIDSGPGNDTLAAGDGGELIGGPDDDVLTGSALYESMDGGPGNDVLRGGGDGDFLAGGPGNDEVHGGAGNDDVIGGGGADESLPAGTDRLYGERGDDSLDDADEDSAPMAINADVVDGGPGVDSVDSYLRRTAPVTIDLTGAAAAGEPGEADVLRGIERATGGMAADTLIGSAAANWLDGRDGDDRVDAGAGDDVVLADDLDDVRTGDGNDVIRTVPSFAGRLRCGAGDGDVVRIDAYQYETTVPLGPYIEGACERLSSGTGFGIGAHPVFSDGRLWFDVAKFRCCRTRLAIGSPSAPFARFASTRVRSHHVAVRVPPALAHKIAAGGVVLRASAGPLGPAVFAWRFFASGTRARAALADVTVAASGRIGPVDGHTFRIGRTLEKQVLRAEGKPDGGRAAKVIGGNGTVVGRDLTYTLRTGKRTTCYRTYEFTSKPGRTLQDFRSNCAQLKTARGTRVDMTATRAIANEGREPQNPPPPFGQTENCALLDAWGISVPSGSRHLVVWLATKPFFDFNPPAYRNVTDIALYGPKSVALAATCKGTA